MMGDVGHLEIVGGPLPFGATKHFTVGNVGVVADVGEVVDGLQVHRDALETVGELAAHRLALETPDLLEVRELADLLSVEPDLPAETPGSERRTFPVVLDEADV